MFLKEFSTRLVKKLIKHNWQTRFKIGMMMFIGSCITYMLRSNFSLILIAMTKNEFQKWSNHDQHLLLSSYFYGYLCPNLCGGFIAEKYGGKNVIFIVFFLSSIITALSPSTASDNFLYLFVARLVLGFLGVNAFFMQITLINIFSLRDFIFALVIISSHDGLHRMKKESLLPFSSAQILEQLSLGL